MILLKLKRDQARCIEEMFFPYMIQVAELKVRDAKKLTDEFYNCKILLTLISEVQNIFKRKLLGQANKFNFKFNDAQGITLYKFLMNQPILPTEPWLLNLRRYICDSMHKQFAQ